METSGNREIHAEPECLLVSQSSTKLARPAIEPLAMPTITLTSLEAGTVKVGQYQPWTVHVLNHTLDTTNLRDCVYIEPENEYRSPGAGL